MKQNLTERTNKQTLLPIFFGLTACSFVPHWACHYYRLETESSFIFGQCSFTVLESLLSMTLYTIIIGLNLFSIVFGQTRIVATLFAGILHLTLGVIHIVRLIHPFKFEIFNLDWPLNSSLREILIVVPFGIICIVIGLTLLRKKLYDIR